MPFFQQQQKRGRFGKEWGRFDKKWGRFGKVWGRFGKKWGRFDLLPHNRHNLFLTR